MKEMTSLNGLKDFLRRYETLLQEKRQGRDEFSAEFQKVKRNSEQLSRDGLCKSTEGAKEHNKKKNRYKDILPFDHSRVILSNNSNIEGSDFINANYVKSPEGRKGYIASQGPLPSTVNDFWRMIWQHKIKIIVMACKEIELGKHRCQRYWPLEGENLLFDNIAVTLVKQKSLEENLIERQIKATLGTEELLLSQIHYTSWPDHGAPRSSRDIIRLVELMREIHPWDDPPVLVHCSAGCGRTGAIVAIDYGRRIIKKLPESFNVFDLVMMLRKQRPAMVQSKEQYEYLYEVFKDLITERIKLSESPHEAAPYVNIDFTPTEDVPIYENFDVSPKVSRKPLPKARPVPVPSGATQGIIVRGNLGEPRKPVITNNARLPQQATIRNDAHHPQLPPKTTPKPINLMDSNHESTNGLPTPLEPAQLSTVEIKKSAPEKDWAPQNYVNVSIGAPKVANQPSPVGNKPPVSSKKPDVSHKKSSSLSQGVGMEAMSDASSKENRLFNKSRSFETLIEGTNVDTKVDLSPPILPAKPNYNKKDQNHKTHAEKELIKSKSVNDLVDGDRPPLPLKHRDILEFESCDNSSTSGKEADWLRGGQLKQDTPNMKVKDPRLSPDGERAPREFVENPLKLFPNKRSDVINRENETQPAASSDGLVSRTQASKKVKNPPGSVNNAPKKATTLPREGLAGRTTPASDGLVNRTKFIVTVEKTEPKKLESSGIKFPQDPVIKERPPITKHRSAETILVSNSNVDSPSSGKVTRPQLANEKAVLSANKNEKPAPLLLQLAEEKKTSNAKDETDFSALYGVVQKPSSKPKEESVYESIWSPKKSPVRIDGPPALPARTADSFIILEENHFAEPKKDIERALSDEKITPTEESPSSAPSDQSSFPWLAVGVDKLRKKLSPKTAFSAAVRSTRQTPSIANSSFFTHSSNKENPQSSSSLTSPKSVNMNFGHRIPQKPKGPRPLPSHWLPVKATSSNR